TLRLRRPAAVDPRSGVLRMMPWLVGAAFAEDLSAVVVGLPSDAGIVECALYASADKWLSTDAVLRRVGARPRDRSARCDFGDLPDGQYAIAIHQDIDEDGQMDYTAGVPQEPWGISRDAPIRLGRPRWVDAVFAHPGKLGPIKARRLW